GVALVRVVLRVGEPESVAGVLQRTVLRHGLPDQLLVRGSHARVVGRVLHRLVGFGDACAALGVGLHVGALAAKLDAVFLGVALGDADQALVRTGGALDLRGARQRLEAARLAARERDLLGGLLLYRCGFAARSAEGVDAARG